MIWSFFNSFPRSINILNIVKYTNHLLIFLFSNVPFSKNKKLKRDEQRGEKTIEDVVVEEVDYESPLMKKELASKQA